jgi:peptidoglycan/xylan/chitin deacetylase (PgdA/CDA1 family)
MLGRPGRPISFFDMPGSFPEEFSDFPEDVLILCYHAVSRDWEHELAVRPDQLERQAAHLRRRGYRGATFVDALTGPGPGRWVAFTFDDAQHSVWELARPVLDAAGFPATIFVPTQFPDTDVPARWDGLDEIAESTHADELRPMTWDQLREAAAAGWELGSHTHTHPHLTQLDDADLHEELVRSREILETQLDRPCRSVAYPYGEVDNRVTEAAREAGYVVGAAVRQPARPLPLRWPRTPVFRGDSDLIFRLRTSPALRRGMGTSTGSSFINAARRVGGRM